MKIRSKNNHVDVFSLLVLIVFSSVVLSATPGLAFFSSYEDSPTDQVAPISTETEESADPEASPSMADHDFKGFEKELPGLGSFFNTMLDTLIGLTITSERRLQTLVEYLPLVFADLYRVFVTL